MALPCIDNSCNIDASIDPETRHLIMKALVAAGGGLIDCYAGLGLGINLIGDPGQEAPIDQGFTKLGLSVGGELWAAPARAQGVLFGGQPVNIPSGTFIGNEGPNSITSGIVLQNPFPNDAIYLVQGRMEVGWTIPLITVAESISTNDSIEWTPYGAEVQSRFYIDDPDANPAPQMTPANLKAAGFHSIGGVWPRERAPHNGRDFAHFLYIGEINGNAKIRFSANAQFIVPDDANVNTGTTYPYNLSFLSSTPGFPDRGFACTGKTFILPIGV